MALVGMANTMVTWSASIASSSSSLGGQTTMALLFAQVHLIRRGSGCRQNMGLQAIYTGGEKDKNKE